MNQSISNPRKLLSIVIPSYNMEGYLKRCLDSLILDNEELMDKLDIIVVNDGSKDKTSSIAHDYANSYPNVIRVIDKSNGHYGSCINAAMLIATGKYFRILDADDWFDKVSLSILLEKIVSIDVDCICTDYTTHEGDNIILHQLTLTEFSYNQIDLNIINLPQECLAMHRLTYNLEFLKTIGYCQTEKVCYTDIEYVYYPLSRARTFRYIPISLYQYFIGRGEQSVSFKSFYKNRDHYIPILSRLLSKRDDERDLNKNYRNALTYVLSLLFSYFLTMQLLITPPTKETSMIIKNLLHRLQLQYPDIYIKVINQKIRFVPFVKLWKFSDLLSVILLYPIRLRMRKNL